MQKQKSSKNASLHHVGMFDGVEMAVVSPVIRSTDFNYQNVAECVNRGFLTLDIGEALQMARFLSRTVLAAQLAQRSYGVPASFLISLGLSESGWEASNLSGTTEDAVEWPGCDCCYSPDAQKWFMETAKLLAESPKYSTARPLMHDVKAFAHKLVSLGFRDSIDMQDVLGPIERYGLEECDLAALRPPNEYSRGDFTAYRDEEGNPKLRASWLDLVDLLNPT